MATTTLPSTTKTPVPDSSSREYAHFADTVYTDTRITDIDTAARYTGEYSRDTGATWTPVPNAPG